MPDFTYNPRETSATLTIFPPGDVELIVGAPKGFLNKNDDGSDKNWGVRFPLISPDDSNKKQLFNAYLHNEGSRGYTKQFQMACVGISRNREGEDQFNDEYGDADYSIDFETGECGDGWKAYDGCRVVATVDVQKNKNTGDEQQQFKGFRPLDS